LTKRITTSIAIRLNRMYDIVFVLFKGIEKVF